MNETDPVLDEIHRTRRQIFESFGGDIQAMLEDAKRRQAASGHAVWQGAATKVPEGDKGRTAVAGENEPARSAG